MRFILLLSLLLSGVCSAWEIDGIEWRSFYIARYKLQNDYVKLVDNNGNGFDPLYGTRNMREVLKGILYRGGANNAYNKHGKRPNENPLPTEGLVNLCQEGFSNAVYLYPDNYNTAPHEETCNSIRGGTNRLNYLQHTGLDSTQAHAVLELIYQTISGNSTGPLYIHCWNGWHSSGYVSAIALRQFCGFNADQAVNYWNINTDGNDGSEYEAVRTKIRAFVPDPSLAISAALQTQICPTPAGYR